MPVEMKAAILSFCDIPALVALQMDTRWEDLVQADIFLSFMRALSAFTQDPHGFRKMMRKTGCIISGSTALHFLLRSPHSWYPKGVDIITPNGTFEDVLRFMLQMPGSYVILDTERHGGIEIYSPIPGGFDRLVKIITSKGPVEIIRSSVSSPFYPLPFYWGTHLMNALTSDICYCAYPSWTTRNEALITTRSPPEDAERKYRERGFKLFSRMAEMCRLTEDCGDVILCGKRERYFGDDHTLVLPLDHPTDPAPPNEDSPPRLTAAWRLGGKACGKKRCFMPGKLAVFVARFATD